MALAVVSCKPKSTKALLPNVSGKAGEVLVVLGKDNWDADLGALVRENMACDCAFLPQKEPLYTLVNVPPAAFTNIFKIHRNIIIFNIDDSVTEPGVVFKSDVWSQPQCVISINAQDVEGATLIASENMEKIISYVEQAERDRVIVNATKYSEGGLTPVVSQDFGGSTVFPMGYKLKKRVQDFTWIAYETTYVNQGILIYRYPASGQDDFTVENIVAHRDSVLKANVPGMFENTYMTTSAIATPEVSYLKYKGRDLAQTRGFWEVQNDFMGGPFVSHSFYSQDGKYVIVFEAFVYAPKYDKRHYLRQVESLLYSFKWDDLQKN